MNIEIIPAELSHTNDYYKLFSSTNVCKFMDLIPFKEIGDSKKYLELALAHKENMRSIRYSIKNENTIIGTICLYSIYWHQKRASIGYALSEENWNKGIMNIVLKKIEKIAKQEFNINRLQATVLSQNTGSKKLLEKNGFRYEGILHQYEIWEGKGFVDLEMYSKIIGINLTSAST